MRLALFMIFCGSLLNLLAPFIFLQLLGLAAALAFSYIIGINEGTRIQKDRYKKYRHSVKKEKVMRHWEW